MNFDTITSIEKFIGNLNNPRKQSLARELVVNPNFRIFEMTILDKTDLFLKDNQNGNTYQLSAFINSKCNCG